MSVKYSLGSFYSLAALQPHLYFLVILLFFPKPSFSPISFFLAIFFSFSFAKAVLFLFYLDQWQHFLTIDSIFHNWRVFRKVLPLRAGRQNNLRRVLDVQCEAAVKLVDIGWENARRCDWCDMKMRQLPSLFQENYSDCLKEMGTEQLQHMQRVSIGMALPFPKD